MYTMYNKAWGCPIHCTTSGGKKGNGFLFHHLCLPRDRQQKTTQALYNLRNLWYHKGVIRSVRNSYGAQAGTGVFSGACCHALSQHTNEQGVLPSEAMYCLLWHTAIGSVGKQLRRS